MQGSLCFLLILTKSYVEELNKSVSSKVYSPAAGLFVSIFLFSWCFFLCQTDLFLYNFLPSFSSAYQSSPPPHSSLQSVFVSPRLSFSFHVYVFLSFTLFSVYLSTCLSCISFICLYIYLSIYLFSCCLSFSHNHSLSVFISFSLFLFLLLGEVSLYNFYFL